MDWTRQAVSDGMLGSLGICLTAMRARCSHLLSPHGYTQGVSAELIQVMEPPELSQAHDNRVGDSVAVGAQMMSAYVVL